MQKRPHISQIQIDRQQCCTDMGGARGRARGQLPSVPLPCPPSSCPCRKHFDGGTVSCQDVIH